MLCFFSLYSHENLKEDKNGTILREIGELFKTRFVGNYPTDLDFIWNSCSRDYAQDLWEQIFSAILTFNFRAKAIFWNFFSETKCIFFKSSTTYGIIFLLYHHFFKK